MKKFILFIFLTFLGCKSVNYHKELSKVSSINLNNKYQKDIFYKLNNSLKDSKSIIYYYQPSFNFDSNDFSGVIYDLNSSKFYYINIENNKIEINESSNNPYSNYHKNNILLYLDNNQFKFTSISDSCFYSGPKIYDHIFEINLENTCSNKEVIFKNFYPCLE
jgi:hypothetical protein